MMSDIENGIAKYKIKYPTMNELIYRANLIIAVDHDGTVKILKSRYKNPKDKLSAKEATELTTDILCRMIFSGRMKIFQEEKKERICKAIEKILNEDGDKQ